MKYGILKMEHCIFIVENKKTSVFTEIFLCVQGGTNPCLDTANLQTFF